MGLKKIKNPNKQFKYLQGWSFCQILRQKSSFYFLTTFVLVFAVFFLPQAAFSTQTNNQELVVTITNSCNSRYIAEGQDYFPNNDPAMFSSVDFALPKLIANTDVSFNVWHALPLSSGHEIAEELDYSMTASRDLLDAFNASLGYVYFDYPKADRYADAHRVWGSFSLLEIPKLPISVSFDLFAAYEFEAHDDGPENGWYYAWGFGTELDLPKFVFTQDDQKINLNITNWGTDGVGGLKSDSLYATEFNISTDYLFNKFTITPNLNYVSSYEDEINDENEIWGGVEVSYTF